MTENVSQNFYLDQELLSVYDVILTRARQLDEDLTYLATAGNSHASHIQLSIKFAYYGENELGVFWESDIPSIQPVRQDNGT